VMRDLQSKFFIELLSFPTSSRIRFLGPKTIRNNPETYRESHLNKFSRLFFKKCLKSFGEGLVIFWWDFRGFVLKASTLCDERFAVQIFYRIVIIPYLFQNSISGTQNNKKQSWNISWKPFKQVFSTFFQKVFEVIWWRTRNILMRFSRFCIEGFDFMWWEICSPNFL
jgi:hypothetical protein